MPRLDVEPAALIRCVNGRVMFVEVDEGLVDQGVHIGPLAEDENGEARLGSVADDASDYFTLLNDAFMDRPLLIDIPRGVVVDRPIVVTHHAAGAGGAAFPRLVVRVAENAQADVMDLHTSEADDDILVCPVVELDVEAAGRLGYLKVQEQGAKTWQFGSVLARAERDATISAATAAFGGAYARTRADTRLVGRGAHGDLAAVYFGESEQTLDFRTYQDHVAPDTTSNLLYKGVVAGESRSVYTGLIRVRPDARGTNAFQTNRNLKLSDDAWAESVPNLEIENNDVKCSHASTVSPVDEDQRFYLESRSVPRRGRAPHRRRFPRRGAGWCAGPGRRASAQVGDRREAGPPARTRIRPHRSRSSKLYDHSHPVRARLDGFRHRAKGRDRRTRDPARPHR